MNRDLSSSFDIDPRAARQGVTGGIGGISLGSDAPASAGGIGGGKGKRIIGGQVIGDSTEGEGEGSASGRE